MGRKLGQMPTVAIFLALPLLSCATADRDARTLPELAGDWDTNHGVVYLDQAGDRVAGEYDFQGRRDNRLEGRLTEKGLEVTFNQPSFPPPLDRGRAALTLRANGTRWEGPWFDAEGTQRGTWDGIKIGATPEEPDREFAPLAPAEVPYPDFTLRTADSASAIHLAEFVRGKPLVLVSTFAGWCKNCNWEAPLLARLYRTYRGRGFEVLQVSEYTHPSDVERFLLRHHPPFPVLVGSTATDDATREGTAHYRFRRQVGDKRKWGTPFNVFIRNGDLAHPWVVPGEMVDKEVEAFLVRELPR